MLEQTSKDLERNWDEMRVSFLLLLVSSISTALLFLYGLNYGKILFVTDLSFGPLILIPTILIVPIISIVISYKLELVGFYLRSFSLLLYVGIFLLSLHSPLLIAFSSLSLVSYAILWLKLSHGTTKPIKKLITLVIANVFMYLVGDLMQFIIEPIGYPATFVPLSNLYFSSAIGVPLLLKGGIAVYSPFFAISISPVSLLLFFSISVLLTENYFKIFSLLKADNSGKSIAGVVYGVASSLSCQCEGGISLLPTMTVLLISTAMVPILFESFLLLIGTNLLITRYYMRGTSVRRLTIFEGIERRFSGILVIAALLIGTPMIEIIGIYLGLINNMLFFFGTGILMTISGYGEISLLGKLLGYRRIIGKTAISMLSVLASFLMFIWYYPPFTLLAFSSASLFTLMSLTSIFSGVIFGFVRISVHGGGQKLLDEFVALMLGMAPIVITYLSAIKVMTIWPEFGITQQIEYGLLAWAVLLPFMWLTTNISLNDTNKKPQTLYLNKPA